MVKIKKYCEEDSKRHGKKDVANANIPQINKPVSVRGWKKCFRRGERLNSNILHVTVVDEASKENDGQRSAVVFDEFPDPPLKQTALADDSTNVTAHKNQKRNHDTEICGCLSGLVPLPGQNLDSLLQINTGYVKSKYVA